jgi:hypothetical protein
VSDKHLVKVRARSRKALVKLQEISAELPEGLDLFRSTATKASAKEYTIDGLLTSEQVQHLVEQGYRVDTDEAASLALETPPAFIEFEDWMAERRK